MWAELYLPILLAPQNYIYLKEVALNLFYKKYDLIYPFTDFLYEKIERTKLSDMHLATYDYALWVAYLTNLVEKPPLEKLPEVAAEYARKYGRITISPEHVERFVFVRSYPKEVVEVVLLMLKNPKLTEDDLYCAERCLSCCAKKECQKYWGENEYQCLRNCIFEHCNIK